MRRLLLPDPVSALLVVTSLAPACGSASEPAPPPVTVAQPVGSWQGRGSTMIGSVVSDSGRFRVRWETRNGRAPGEGTFRLTFRSAVSGRPIQVVVDHRGEGDGTADFADDPRTYDFVVDSRGVDWSFSVEEIFVGPAPGGS